MPARAVIVDVAFPIEIAAEVVFTVDVNNPLYIKYALTPLVPEYNIPTPFDPDPDETENTDGAPGCDPEKLDIV